MSKQMVQYHSPAGLAGVEILTCQHVDLDFPDHIHDTLTVWVNDLGCEYFRFKGNTAVLDRSGFGVVNAGEVHANGAVASTFRSLRTFYVDMDVCSSLFERSMPLLADGLYTDATLHTLLACLHGLLWHSTDTLECQSIFVEVFAEMLTRHGRLSAPPRGRESWRYTRTRELLHASMGESLSLQSLADAADCSPQHLLRLFRTHAGVSPHAYLVCLRIARVRRLLKTGWSVADAAAECGFADQSHCTRWFRKLTGITPFAYREAVHSS